MSSRVRKASSEPEGIRFEKVKLVPTSGMTAWEQVDKDLLSRYNDAIRCLKIEEELKANFEKEVKTLKGALLKERDMHNNTRLRLDPKNDDLVELRGRIADLEVDLQAEKRLNRASRRAEAFVDQDTEFKRVVDNSYRSVSHTSGGSPTPTDIDEISTTVSQMYSEDDQSIDTTMQPPLSIISDSEDSPDSQFSVGDCDIFTSVARNLGDMTAVALYNVLQYPLDALTSKDDWFYKAFHFLNDDLGIQYRNLLENWVILERNREWSQGLKSRSLDAKYRPREVSRWIGGARYRDSVKRTCIASERIIDFTKDFWQWWCNLQPEWRPTIEVDTVAKPRVLTTNDENKSWKKLNVAGQNGWLSLIVCVKWWGLALQSQACNAPAAWKEDWEQATDDLLGSLEGVLRYLGIPGARKV
ncbi:hypothetical protein D9758_015909 [Tetrapyrgos nigripes]|uniref:Uncharacterized protein n=1 Tax=Tetrapyrgos nigripes TaxID=182062 RepID=A0A8H5CJA1_9AGAR|nr:hypothetical protein D9758_015909 [Tetrapyrgos nigripes]